MAPLRPGMDALSKINEDESCRDGEGDNAETVLKYLTVFLLANGLLAALPTHCTVTVSYSGQTS